MNNCLFDPSIYKCICIFYIYFYRYTFNILIFLLTITLLNAYFLLNTGMHLKVLMSQGINAYANDRSG